MSLNPPMVSSRFFLSIKKRRVMNYGGVEKNTILEITIN